MTKSTAYSYGPVGGILNTCTPGKAVGGPILVRGRVGSGRCGGKGRSFLRTSSLARLLMADTKTEDVRVSGYGGGHKQLESKYCSLFDNESL